MAAPLQPIMLRSFPTAIVHVDGDAFFASVEQAIHPEWKGKPVVTGKERGIIASASYEAKQLGVARGVPLYEAKRKCPSLVVLPSDYETYSLYSKRMFDIMRRYTPVVEEYSIDEGFADLLGVRRVFRTSYEEIVRRMQEDIHRELDITVSCGLSLTKSLAKLASKFQKPRGLTVVPGHQIHLFLPQIPLERVWGFGPNTVGLLSKHGLRTAWDFVARSEAWAAQLLGKVGRDIWHELRGESVYAVEPEEKSAQYTLCKGKTFTPPSRDREFVYAQLVRNVESAFIKLRRHELRAKWLCVGLRRQDFREDTAEAELNRATSATMEVMPMIRALFDALFQDGVEYRATMVVLGKLERGAAEQRELFEDNIRIEKMSAVSRVVDEINERYGKHKIALGPSLFLDHQHKNERGDLPWRKTALLEGETPRKRLHLPRLAIRV